MTVDKLWYDTLGQACRIGVERSLMGLVQDLLQSGGYVWSEGHGVWSCCKSGEDGRCTHVGIRKGIW